MKIQLLAVPYDTGHFNERMGRGPTHLLNNGVPDSLKSDGHDVEAEVIEIDNGYLSEIGSAFELKREISRRVSQAISRRR